MTTGFSLDVDHQSQYYPSLKRKDFLVLLARLELISKDLLDQKDRGKRDSQFYPDHPNEITLSPSHLSEVQCTLEQTGTHQKNGSEPVGNHLKTNSKLISHETLLSPYQKSIFRFSLPLIYKLQLSFNNPLSSHCLQSVSSFRMNSKIFKPVWNMMGFTA